MPHTGKPDLPAPFRWVEGAGKDTVFLASIPVVQVAPAGNAWLASVVFDAVEVVPQQMVCRSQQAALRWASRWVHQRVPLLTRAAERMGLKDLSASDAA